MSQEPSWLYFPEWLEADTWHFPYAYRTFRNHIPENSLVLEVGCGSGRILTKIAGELNCKCIGVDVEEGSFPAVSFYSRQEGVQVETIKGDGFSLPFKGKTFDVVYSEGVIEHFPLERSAEMIREHSRVCKPGGLVIISVPNKFALFHSFTKLLLGPRFLFYPEASLSNAHLSKMMSKTGLIPIARDGFAFGCQFYMFQAFYLEQHCPLFIRNIGAKVLALMKKLRLYHFDNPRLNSVIGFQTMVIGQRKSSL
ncbi:MAG: class I SAM-dependent methyltransferase [Chloroflexota bacterium]|nr:class I SAM-dependent methyltransferase [Chloroflexota bacterium]